MKLNKIFAIALCALCFTACSDDDDKPEIPETPDTPENPDTPNNPDNPDNPDNQLVFVLNQGNMGKNIPGSLSKIDLTAGTIVNNAFKDANGRILGDTPQCAMIYGSKLYVGVYQSNTIEVMDAVTLKSEKTISLSSTAKGPRGIAAKDGYVYFSMYDGYAARLDTLSLTIDKTIKVGPNPDEIAIAGNYLYVTNSDGMNFNNSYADGYTVSKINLSTFTEEKKINVGMNPTKIVSNGTDVFVISMGDYSSVNPSTLKQIKEDDSVETLFNAGLMAINGDKLYCVYAPYTKKDEPAIPPTYYEYVISTKVKTELQLANIISPVAIGINPSTGNIFVSSYSVEYGYSDPCIVNEYSSTGTFLKKYDVGVGAGCFVF